MQTSYFGLARHQYYTAQRVHTHTHTHTKTHTHIQVPGPLSAVSSGTTHSIIHKLLIGWKEQKIPLPVYYFQWSAMSSCATPITKQTHTHKYWNHCMWFLIMQSISLHLQWPTILSIIRCHDNLTEMLFWKRKLCVEFLIQFR